jgi:hypothetical protein
MASPGVRAYQIAGALARAMPEAEITLGMPAGQEPTDPPEPRGHYRTCPRRIC